jgi:hypothetical protein
MLKVNGSPLGSLAVGWKLYGEPAITDVAGVPLITGAPLGAGVRHAANAVLAVKSCAAQSSVRSLVVILDACVFVAMSRAVRAKPVRHNRGWR